MIDAAVDVGTTIAVSDGAILMFDDDAIRIREVS
jgi:hypothetical protein